MSTPDPYPYPAFRFEVQFREPYASANEALVTGWFSECTGLEATMEPKVIKEGGNNYGHAQRVGYVSFAPLILKRGVTSNRFLWEWFSKVTLDAISSIRMSVLVLLRDMPDAKGASKVVMAWRLDNALPVKFKAGDLNAVSGQIAVEELHLVHEGLEFQAAEVES